VLRAVPKLSRESKVVVNQGTIVPFSLAIQGAPYPPLARILEKIRAVTPAVFEVDGPALVKETGIPRTLNVVMLGALAGLKALPFDPTLLLAAVEKKSPPKYLAANRKAFALGRSAVEKH
jgi:Pyruvate/2-oxoacid:ferredoxin oxidoreductase gamma subunit